jgi:hypothetical protein
MDLFGAGMPIEVAKGLQNHGPLMGHPAAVSTHPGDQGLRIAHGPPLANFCKKDYIGN